MYLFVPFDTSILLTNDRKALFGTSWEDCKKYFANGGKTISNLKKVRDFIDRD
jgi:hypothetical protein